METGYIFRGLEPVLCLPDGVTDFWMAIHVSYETFEQIGRVWDDVTVPEGQGCSA